jgi:hypothetical protein
LLTPSAFRVFVQSLATALTDQNAESTAEKL